ncbi:MAG TPA: imidazole glycerol phosphate synthase subunit HisH [Gammaproteobacteria bacterium]|nr:imidazole glycerol phosphate synthase subunit HisH [Gammaproteobacteria bacterium]
MSTIAVIDYGMGNLHSIAKALTLVAPEQQIWVTHDAEKIRRADRLVLPGVGAIRDCMQEIKRYEIDELCREQVQQKPLLGVCVGLQALLNWSEENDGTHCIGLIPGEVKRFVEGAGKQKLKIPHMGWNQVAQSNPNHPMWANIKNCSRFYFVHSYYAVPDDASVIAGTTEFGIEFVSALHHDNIFATQFHPEKSQKDGLQLLQNFVRWNGQCN